MEGAFIMSYYFPQFLYNIYEYSNYHHISVLNNILYEFDIFKDTKHLSSEQENIIKHKFIDEAKKHTSFQSITINKELTLSIDHKSRNPLGIYYIEDNGIITAIDIFEFGNNIEISKYQKGILYYTDNIKFKIKGKINFENISLTRIITFITILFLLVAFIASFFGEIFLLSLT